MRAVRILLPVIAVCALLVVGAPRSASTSPSPAVDDVGAAANQQLADVRRATAKYHDFDQAVADGFLQATGCVEGEGIHYRSGDEFAPGQLFQLLDCEFNPEDPEVLHYVPKPNGELQLVGVEYLVPVTCQTGPPEGFTGDADEWELEINNTVWALNAWIWQGVPDGVFAFRSDKITCD